MAEIDDNPNLDDAPADGVTADERQQLVPDLLARRFASDPRSYWQIVWDDFRKNIPAFIALWVMFAMAMLAIVAPLVANHRPYFLYLPGGAIEGPAKAVLNEGWQFPLFGSLGMADWFLLFGFVQAFVAFVMYRRLRRDRSQHAHPIAVTVQATIGLAPALAAVLFSPAIRRRVATGPTEGATGLLGQPGWVWAIMAVVAAVGAALLIRSIMRLYTGKRDEFGNLLTGRSIFMGFCGSLALVIAASWVGTLGQRQLDTTDYVEIAARDGARAVFPPVQHDFLKSESYVKYQPPLGPYVRVQPSGGSQSAIDLGLSDHRRHANLAEELSPASPGGLTRETPLSHLRNGSGARAHDDGLADFTIVTRSMARRTVSLSGAMTVGDVLDTIDAAAKGDITASIAPGGTRIILADHTTPRPRSWMGTDASGADVASRLVHATRVALSIGLVSTSIALLIGVTVGALMGYFGGWVDIVGMRVIEIFMAIPRLFLLLTIIAFIPPEWNEYMLYAMMAVIGATTWMHSARFIRAEFFRLRNQDFVQAAQACGLPMRSILFKHMLPNGVTPVLVDASFGIAAAIFVETGLSFLGFGIKPPNPSWGKMLFDAVDPATGVFHWWLAVFPGIMIFLTVFAFNLIGDALRDAIDPKLKKAAH